VDVREYNRGAWDHAVRAGNRWTVPVGPEVIAAARRGEWSVVLTPAKPVPREWFPPLAGAEVLCLASGGGQQGPVLAAAGAHVTVFDNSPAQLGQDRTVADRDGLLIATEEGDMADLSRFPDARFDLVFHPCSNAFVPNVLPVWRECFRVLRPGGTLLAGVCNPVQFLFDEDRLGKGECVVKYTIPYSDLVHLSADELCKFMSKNEPLVFGHTLEDQLGGQLAAGFLLAGLYEDTQPDEALGRVIPAYLATRAIKPPALE
jgi:SAM-dependent methyltransferase